jgi:adenylate cyclase
MIAVRIWDPFPVESLRLKFFDTFQRIQPRVATGYPVVVVDIVEASLASYGQWPWSRIIIANLIESIFRSGAVVLGFDVVFAEPDRTSPGMVAKNIKGLSHEMVEQLKKLPSNDMIMANMLGRARVILGQVAASKADTGFRPGNRIKIPVAEVGGDPRPYLNKFKSLVPNLDILEQAASGRGLLALVSELDGVVRRVPAVFLVDNVIRPSLVIEMMRVATGGNAYAIKSNNAGIKSIVVGRTKIPTDGQGRIWVHYAKHNPLRYLSAKKVLDGTAPLNRLKGKLVLIGTSAPGLFDVKATPITGLMPGVEVHAQLLETILARSNLSRPNYVLGAELLGLLVTGLIIIVLLPMVGAWWTLLVGGVLGTTLMGGGWYLYAKEQILLDFSYTAVSAFLMYTLLNFLSYAREEAGRQQIKNAFSRYMSPEVVTQLAEDPSKLVLGGQNRDMTLLFSDVQGFTSISEKYNAEGLTSLVNKILSPLTEAVLMTGGTVDKYMGDSIMAFWNAPLDDADHARHACLAALGICAAIAPLNEVLAADACEMGHEYTPIKVGVGVNSGICCVGNMGSDLRFDYSVLGDTVNTAARLEGQTRTYRVANVIGETSMSKAPGLAFLELDLVRVVGKTQPVRIFTLLGDETYEESAEFQKLALAHQEMIGAYRALRWGDAMRALNISRSYNSGLELGKFYDLMEERITEFMGNPPATGWDAVYEATSKH